MTMGHEAPAIGEVGMAERLLTPTDLAAFLGVPEKTLAQWRCDRHGPLPLRVGRYVRYRPADVEDWVEQQAAEARRRMAS